MAPITVTELFAFPDSTFIENVIVRPNGNVLFTSVDKNQVFELNPASSGCKPQPVAEIPDTTSLTGIVRVGHDTYAVSGGVMPGPFAFAKGSMHVHTVSFETPDQESDSAGSTSILAKVQRVADVVDTEMMNGMAVISSPSHGTVLLSADSKLGRIFRINLRTGLVDVAFQDDLLADPKRVDRVPCGVNGIKVHKGHMYFVNSALRIFGRVPINEAGDRVGDIEYMSTISDAAAKGNTDDDFDIGPDGAAWVARHPGSLVKIGFEDKTQTTIVDGSTHSVPLQNPTATAWDLQRNILYVVTGGLSFTGGVGGGQVVKVEFA